MSEIIDQIKVYNKILEKDHPTFSMRLLTEEIVWQDRLLGILGPKGVGKTTVLIRRLVEGKKIGAKYLYIALDHPMFTNLSLYELAQECQQYELTGLLLDEVHKYPNWSAHVKSIYDTFKKISVVFSGSSALHLLQGRGDLSRRATMFKLPILSFREFLQLEHGFVYKIIKLKDLLAEHNAISEEISKHISPLKLFKQYLEYGAYPFYKEGLNGYFNKILNVINHTLENDLVFINGLDARFSSKLRGLLKLVSMSVPFVPKITDLAQSLEISRPTVSQYLEYLQEGGLIRMIPQAGKGYQKLSKPEKIYLDNTNLLQALGLSSTNIGTIRETFVASQLSEAKHLVEAAKEGDFFIDSQYTFEVGGKNKDLSQIDRKENSFLICDDIEYGSTRKIPIWLLGFLY